MVEPLNNDPVDLNNKPASLRAGANLSGLVQTGREASNEVQKRALAKHITKKGATRQTNVAVSTEVSSEQTKTESRDEEFTNPWTNRRVKPIDRDGDNPHE